MLFHLFKDDRNKLFGQTRWRLATWYAGIMGAILVLCGLGLYKALTYAHRLTITQELESVANNLHETLEPILKKPGKLAPETTTILPNLCLVNTECLPVHVDPQKASFHSRQYYIRLLNPAGNLIATAGKPPQNLLGNRAKKSWQKSIDTDKHYYQQVSVMLHDRDFQRVRLFSSKVKRLTIFLALETY